uniref:Sodium voltage-gated channel beta subunit 4 n=1 Tax=Equus caballus TaxID=9796 RepID=A0A9L0RFE3_HORSE
TPGGHFECHRAANWPRLRSRPGQPGRNGELRRVAWAVPIEVKRTILPKLTLRVTETSLPGQATPPCPTVPLPSSSLEVPILDGIVKNEKSDPKVKFKDDERITLEGSIKEKVNNISILLRNVDFSDTGKYTCFVKNPKENHAGHNATIFLQVVDKLEEVDNTVTLIILAVVGGVIGLLIFIMLVKKFIAFVLKKTQEKKKECLVSSSGNDNTENGLPGSKAEEKPPTKV